MSKDSFGGQPISKDLELVGLGFKSVTKPSGESLINDSVAHGLVFNPLIFAFVNIDETEYPANHTVFNSSGVAKENYSVRVRPTSVDFTISVDGSDATKINEEITRTFKFFLYKRKITGE